MTALPDHFDGNVRSLNPEEHADHLPADAKDTLKRSAMASGRRIDPWNVVPEDIFIEDIARGLAHINRFNGQFGSYSVAQHSVFVARVMPDHLHLAALIHDASEFLTGDLAHHIKHGQGFLGMCWRQLDAPITAAIERRFGLEDGETSSPEIKIADDRIFNMEWEYLAQHKVGAGSRIFDPWTGEKAESEFLREFDARYTRPR